MVVDAGAGGRGLSGGGRRESGGIPRAGRCWEPAANASSLSAEGCSRLVADGLGDRASSVSSGLFMLVAALTPKERPVLLLLADFALTDVTEAVFYVNL